MASNEVAIANTNIHECVDTATSLIEAAGCVEKVEKGTDLISLRDQLRRQCQAKLDLSPFRTLAGWDAIARGNPGYLVRMSLLL